ncbi:hypothetical protein, partial [Stenotrophomonas ginsengisoli]|uniref:hypothetical protein n=1 Tax=Stenotrophomonas ginsengisoli TaxID=336566 RepID=UPI001B80E5A1
AGEVGFRAAGDIAQTMQDRAMTDLASARASGDAAAEADALERLNSWNDGGTSKTLLHGITGAAVAALGGAMRFPAPQELPRPRKQSRPWLTT